MALGMDQNDPPHVVVRSEIHLSRETRASTRQRESTVQRVFLERMTASGRHAGNVDLLVLPDGHGVETAAYHLSVASALHVA